jgi:excisionase family DNA binding protein
MAELELDDDKLYTTKEVAAAAGLSDDSWIRRLLIEGRLKGQKIGFQWLVYGRDLRAWLEAREADKPGQSGEG